jgi:hypothetical protein
MLIQADRFGTSIARAVRVYSDSLRTKRPQRAEQAAQKAAFKLLLPLGALLFPTMFIIILGPALLNISDMLSGGGRHSNPREDPMVKRSLIVFALTLVLVTSAVPVRHVHGVLMTPEKSQCSMRLRVTLMTSQKATTLSSEF